MSNYASLWMQTVSGTAEYIIQLVDCGDIQRVHGTIDLAYEALHTISMQCTVAEQHAILQHATWWRQCTHEIV